MKRSKLVLTMAQDKAEQLPKSLTEELLRDLRRIAHCLVVSATVATLPAFADQYNPPPPSPAPSQPPVGRPSNGSGDGDFVPVAPALRRHALQSGTDSTTLQTGTGSTTLQTGTGSTTLQTGTGAATIQSGVEKEAEPLNILFIVDGSRSMLEKLEGSNQKMDAAKQVLQNAISRIPSDVNLGLRVFGQGYTGTQPTMFGGGFGGIQIDAECRNSALWVPIGRGNRRTIIEKVRQIKPYGMTPLAYAIEQAAMQDFRGTTGKKIIILITDGADTCGGNPCEVVRRLPLFGIKIKLDVVGLDLHREPGARNQLNCIAKESGGTYSDASTAAQLIDSVSASVSKAIEGRVIIRPSAPGAPTVVNPETPPELVPIEPMKPLDK
jgi:Mg-chelatase subunit ChlD